MRCSLCDGFRRDHRLMCEVEATAILQQRYTAMLRYPQDSLAPERADQDDDHVREEIVLISRKRQAKIVFRLEQHRAQAHCA